MRFGLLDHTETQADRPLRDVFAQHVRLAQTADEAGLWGYHTTEHHLSALDATPSPSVYLAALATVTERIRLGSLVHIVPGYHPVRLAEEVIMLDHLSGGRFEMGVGKGVSPPEHRLLDLVTDEVADVFDDHLARMVDVLEGRPVDGAPIPFRPLQDPYPPLWYAGNAARAAELNMHAILGGPARVVGHDVTEHRRIVAAREGPSRFNPTVERTTIGAARHVLVDRDGSAARRRAIEAWSTYTAHINHHFDRTGERAKRDPTVGGDAVRAMDIGVIAAGSPQAVAENYIELAEVGRVDYLLGVFFWGDLEVTEALASFELFVTEVIPAVEAAVGHARRAG